MRKWTTAFLTLAVMIPVTACSSPKVNDTAIQEAHSGAVDTQAVSDDIDITEEPQNIEEKILIAYFTWAENAAVPSDVDAIASASVQQPGNVAQMASWIRQEVGGDLFSIRVEEPYSFDYDECLDRASDEKAENASPALIETVSDLSGYDVVFLGYPKMEYGFNCVSCA
ncbi:MAG: hypothetical protein PHR92_01290 [Lachnospiraceae bacterium]|nr:hypothetical protein [Lachnospiraceae bacterium]